MILPWRRGTSPVHLLDDALSAVAAADWTADEPPTAWIHWPVDLSNPYQMLIYSRFPQYNLVPIRLHSYDLLEPLLAALPSEMPKVLHVHWLYEVTAGSGSEAEARARVDTFTAEIRALRERDVRLVWTVHNLLPHETKYPDVERQLRLFMLTTADVVHVMHDSHLKLLRSTFDVEPAHTVVVPHPSFAGAYPDWMDRDSARSHLGIPHDARVLVTFGQVRPYKGHQAFLDIFDRAAERDPGLRWLVAGKVRDEPGAPEFGRQAAGHPAVLFHPGFVTPIDVQYYLRAADVAVFPYVSSLNSGALALSSTFDLPAYASTGTRLGDLVPPEAVVRFDLEEPDATVELLTEPEPALLSDSVREAVRNHARGLAPDVISMELAAAMRSQLAAGGR